MGVTRDVCLKKLNELEGEINHFYSMLDSNEKKSIDIWYVNRTLENKLRKLKKIQQLKSQINKDEDVRTYKIISIAKDGNCFYRCLSYFLHGSQMYHESLREGLTQCMYKNSHKYNHLVDGDIHVHLSAQRCTNGRLSSWATGAELKAATDHHKISIHVSTDRKFTEWLQFEPSINVDRPLRLLLENSHFSVLEASVDGRQHTTHDTDTHVYDWFEGKPTEPVIYLKKQNTANANTNVKRPNDTKAFKAKQVKENKPQISPQESLRKKSDETKSSVTNLSKHVLTDAEQNLLEKGLKFIPSRKNIDKVKLLADLWE
ncbi:hypothetical protein DPMN_012327 [Dreissena polymorpha]|uniref:OTU domain-containing protein n=1 Tax=Dreissena polymorpha TaxID=45954 RepID=A0A9D4N5R9_DREPO|nr:hypothetical protein DPMN_012327 [Dreissena polymorpha]